MKQITATDALALSIPERIQLVEDIWDIYRHDVSESEIEEVLLRPVEDRLGQEGSRVAIGRTSGGRYLRVIYVPDPEPNSVFVITAYELRGKPLSPIDVVEGESGNETE